jgi:arylformamidase
VTKIIDITVPLSGQLPRYPGEPGFELDFADRISDGAPYNASTLRLAAHTGTHVDAPYHFLADGKTVDQLPLEILVGKCRVIEISDRERIERADLEAADLRDDIRLLIKTRMSGLLRQPEFQEDLVYLTPDAATYLVQAGLKLVGIDYLSIDEFGNQAYPAHTRLLSADVIIVEGLDLSEVAPGAYDLTCLPLRVVGGDGAPARAILRRRL